MGIGGVQHRVFVSYSRADDKACDEVVKLLSDAGHRAWYDRGNIVATDVLEKVIREQIEDCTAFLLLASAGSLASEWVSKEIGWAHARARSGALATIVSIQIDDCDAVKDQRINNRHIIDGRAGLRAVQAEILAALPAVRSLPPRETIPLKDYFEMVLPTMMRWQGDAALVGGSVLFDVSGAEAGQWTLQLREPAAMVIRGKEGRPDMTISITTDEMRRMLAGTFNARDALANGTVELSGDLNLLKTVGQMFQR